MKIALVSCSKRKMSYPCPAKELYSASRLFSLSYEYAKRVADKIYILSAKYGLISDSQVIAPYDLCLNNLPENRQEDWANYVLKQLKTEFDLQNDTFIIMAGKNYYRNLIPYISHWELPLGNLQLGARITFLQKQLENSSLPEKNNSDITLQLHKLFASMPRYSWRDIDKIPFQNGIYIMFEEKEQYRGYPKIVRVGTHTSDGRLKGRLRDHFLNENKDGSIFRKNIGKAILNRQHDPYLRTWSLNTSKQEMRRFADTEKEKEIEKQVSIWLRENITFTVFEVPTREQRLRLEEAIIACLHKTPDFRPGADWLGAYSSEWEIRESGMWLKEGLQGIPLTDTELQWLLKLGKQLPEKKPQATIVKAERVGSAQIKEYLHQLLDQKKKEGRHVCVLVSGDIHKAMGLKNKMPTVCDAMYQIMGPKDKILHTTPSGHSSTIKIEYFLR